MYNFLIVILIAVGASALTLHARQTDPIDFRYGSGISPRPTSGPMQVRPDLKHIGQHIFARTSNTAYQTCGWVDKDHDQAITCQAGFACAFFPSGYSALNQGVLQCCVTSGTSIEFDSCDPGTKCVDYLTRYNTEATPIIESGTWYCGSVGQTCATFLFEGGKSYWSSSLAAEVYTGLFCADDVTTEYVYQVYTGVSSSASSSSSSSSRPPSSSSTTSSLPPGSTSTSSQPSSSSTVTSSSSNSGPSSSSSAGVIAGATVGGVVGLAAIAATVGFLVWRKKRQSIPPSREISTYDGSAYGGSPAQGFGSNYGGGSSYGDQPQMYQQVPQQPQQFRGNYY